jgi:hypothetical protein
MYRSMFVGLVVLMWSTGAQAASCNARFSFIFSQVSNGAMGAASGVPCAATIGRTGTKTVIKSIKVTVPPKNGTASAGSHGVTYRSKPGYKGSDSFTFTVFGDGDAGPNTTATVQMQVTVD